MTRKLPIFAAALAMLGAPAILPAQDHDDTPAITARVHATFVDAAGGLGVMNGDMSIVRFEVRHGTVTAIGRIDGALADSAGHILGHVDEELALPVENVTSTCNQLRMELAAVDADILDTSVHFDREAAGFDSREGATPKALGVLCAAGKLLQNKPAPDAIARALNDIAVAVRTTGRR